MKNNKDPPTLTDQGLEKSHHNLDFGQESQNKPLKVIPQVQMPLPKDDAMYKVYMPSLNFLQMFEIQTFIICPIWQTD